MNNVISNVVDIIVHEQEYRNYFFSNFYKMENPELWFKPLYDAKLLYPEDRLVLPYVRALINNKELQKNCNFIELISRYLEYFMSDNTDIMLALWFIEEVITADEMNIASKCKAILLKQSDNNANIGYIVTKMSLNTLDKLIFADDEIAYKIAEKITDENNFASLSSNTYELLQVRDKLFKYLHNTIKRKDYEGLIFLRLIDYLKANPNEFSVLNTIEQSYIFNYSDYIIGWLLNVIKNNTNVENKELCSKFDRYIKNTEEIEEHEVIFILKIFTYIIYITNNFEMINKVEVHVRSLDMLSKIKVALYHNVLEAGIKKGYVFLPDFENWLLNLKFSDEVINHVNDGSKIEKRSTQIKLELLKIFGEDRASYKTLKANYLHEITVPEKSFYKSSWESTNNYLNDISLKSIDEIIRIINGEKPNIESDFSELHIEEAIKKDFQQNLEKYKGQLKYIFEHLDKDNAKSWFVQEIAGLNRQSANPQYKEILDILLDTQTKHLIYFLSILNLLNSLLQVKEPLSNYEDKIQKFLLMNDDKLANELKEVDVTGGGRNSISGKIIDILIQLSLQQSNLLDKFVEHIDKYQSFLAKPNGLYSLGRYLFWLYPIDKFQTWFKHLDVYSQVIMFSAYCKYNSYRSDPLYNYSKEIKLLTQLDNVYSYMNYVFYMYLIGHDEYLISIIKENIDDENILNAVVASMSIYEKQIIEKSAQSKVLHNVCQELLNSKHKGKISTKLLYHSNFIDIDQPKDILLFKSIIVTQTINSIANIKNAQDKLTELLMKGKFADVLDILEECASNEHRDFYGASLAYLDDLIGKLAQLTGSIKSVDVNYKKFINLKERLKQLNYN